MTQSTEELMLVKLDQLVRLMTINIGKGLKQREQIVLLDHVGFPPKDIADVLGTTGNTVSKELSRLRKSKTSGLRPTKRLQSLGAARDNKGDDRLGHGLPSFRHTF